MRLTRAMTAARLPRGLGIVLEIHVRTTMKQHWAPIAIRNIAKNLGARSFTRATTILPMILTHMGIMMWKQRSRVFEVENDTSKQMMNVAVQTGQVSNNAMTSERLLLQEVGRL